MDKTYDVFVGKICKEILTVLSMNNIPELPAVVDIGRLAFQCDEATGTARLKACKARLEDRGNKISPKEFSDLINELMELYPVEKPGID